MVENFSHSATVLQVKNLQESCDFYVNKLGFKVHFEWEEPPLYVVLKRGGVNIHLSLNEAYISQDSDSCSLYIFVHDIASIHQTCLEKGVTLINSPEERDYLMKDFDVKDPDGYIITFGKRD